MIRKRYSNLLDAANDAFMRIWVMVLPPPPHSTGAISTLSGCQGANNVSVSNPKFSHWWVKFLWWTVSTAENRQCINAPFSISKVTRCITCGYDEKLSTLNFNENNTHDPGDSSSKFNSPQPMIRVQDSDDLAVCHVGLRAVPALHCLKEFSKNRSFNNYFVASCKTRLNLWWSPNWIRAFPLVPRWHRRR